MEQPNLNDNVDSLFRSLEDFTQNEGIIGKPVTHGNKTFLPVVSITVGYGGGNASLGKNQTSNSSGTGAVGLGAKLSTDAVIFIDNENVTMLPVNSNATTLMDKIPNIISGMKNQQGSQNQSSDQNSSMGAN